MKGKPLLVAVATFVIVLLGGAAMAGIGTYASSQESRGYASPSDETHVTLTTTTPEATTTTVAEKELEPEPVEEEKANHEDASTTEEAKAEEDTTEEDTTEDARETEDAHESAPVFTLTHPEDGARFTSKVVVFGGEASEGVVVHRGKYEATPHGGEWAMELVLSPGKNHVSFEGVDANGDVTKSSVTVYYDAPVDEGKDETSTFIAHQKYGSCGEEIPYDVFYGTAKPGAKISASSEYGSNSTTANEHGKWEMKVTFPEAPSGKTFNVTIKASTGQSKTFTFTNTGGEQDH
jgi:hypothetical protein